MSYFEKYFDEENHVSDQGEMFVKCPFPHTDPETGETYRETRASAHVNLDKSVFHCKVCKTHHSEVSFYASIHHMTYRQALELIELSEKTIDNWTGKEELLTSTPTALKLIEDFGWQEVYEEVRLGYEGAGISFPVLMNDVLMGSCRYVPDGDPKTKLSKGAKNLIFPYDLWEKDRPTLLTAGFKDATTARSKGFNAITFTHGEGSLPTLFKYSFKDQKVYIAYDNDAPGKQGAIKTAIFIREAGGFPFIVDISTVCTDYGEDIHDFFHKYGKSKEDLQTIIDETQAFDDETYEIERNKEYPLITLEESTQGKYHNSLVSSRVVVTAKWETVAQVPEYVEFEKFRVDSEKNDQMFVGQKIHFALDEDNIRDVLYLSENEDKLKMYLKKLAKVPIKEQGISMKIMSYVPVFQAVVSDDISSSDKEYKPFELTVYSIKQSLSSGAKVRLFYKSVPHPLQEQRIVGLVTRFEDSDIAISNFKVTDDVIESLKVFQTDNVAAKMKENAERTKAIAGVETLPQLAWATDLFYHTPLEFMWGDRTERAYLDIMIIGESRTGKSQTAKKLMDLYELGIFTSLKTTTKAGLIGGSDQTAGGFKTKLGVLPRNHKGAVIMEEFSGASKDLISSLTDIRSSNMVRIDRVNGTTVAPAMVRMMSISNQRKSSQGETIPLRQQSSGVEVVTNLIGAAEDIGRYDFFMLIDKPDDYISPNEKAEMESYPKESYLNRVRWAWSRSKEQINISDEVKDLIVSQSTRLNKTFDSHINFFGSETWKKLTRLAIATAAMCVSTDENFETIVVEENHVIWAKNFLVACYDNDLFNLRSYVDNERKYSTCPEQSIVALQGMYRTNKNLIVEMSRGTEFSQRQLQALAGLENKDFNRVISTFAECYFIRYSRTGERIVPTERFRKAYKHVSKSDYMKRVGQEI